MEEIEEDFEERFNTLGDNGKVSEFLKWYEKPLQRHAQSGEFYQFNGKKWEALEDDLLGREIRNFFIAKGIKKYSAIRIKKMIDLFKYELEPTAKHNPHLLAFNNGILDKRSLKFTAHTSKVFITSFINADYSEQEQPTPNFDKWLNFVTNGNLERAKTILAGLFMVLTNADKWQLFIEVTGAGGTGKSTYTEIAKLLAGENNHVGITLKALDDEVKRCIIIDKTFIISGEQPKYTGDGATIRAITGGDDIFFNPKHKKPFSQKVNAVFMTTNNTPILFTENSGGTERRRVIFKFDRIVPIEERDFNLIEKIQAETGGIIRLLFDTFPEPLEAKALLEKQRVSQEALAVKMEVNHVLEFAQEFEILPTVNGLAIGSSLNNGTRDSAIYPAYIYFCQLNDIEPINRRTFTRAFKQALKELDKGEYQTRESNGRTVTNVRYIDKQRTFNKWQG
nr:phage/plasmid primase, P4 family [Mannheimia haemolytica]